MGKKLKPKEYNEKYGDISNDFSERFIDLWDTMNIKTKDIPTIQSMIRRIYGIQTKEISFVFYFVPEATPRPRYSRFTKAFYVKNSIDYKTIFSKFIENVDDIDEITTPCEFICKTYKPIPSSMTKYEKILAELGLIKDISKPDWDNLAKTYCDMIQHGLLLDDSLIYKGSTEKLYSIKPRVEITIRYYVTHDSTFNQRKVSKTLNKRKE